MRTKSVRNVGKTRNFSSPLLDSENFRETRGPIDRSFICELPPCKQGTSQFEYNNRGMLATHRNLPMSATRENKKIKPH